MHKKHIFIYCLLLFFSCKNTESNNEIKATKELEINYKNLEQLEGLYGRCSFKVPKGIYKKTEENIFISKRLNSRIEFISNRWDPSQQEFISTKEELIDIYKKNIHVISIKHNNEYFEILGTDNKNYIYLIGFYQLINADDGTGGEKIHYSILGFLSGILKVQIPIENKSDFDNLIPILKNSYKCNFGEF